MRVLVVDNVDSFTWNLAQAFQALGARVDVVRHDATDPDDVRRRDPTHVVLSPGPGRPEDAGATPAIARAAVDGHLDRPLLGVCLGMQALGLVTGAAIVHAARPRHGFTSAIRHDGRGLFVDQPAGLRVGRYHSLVVDPATLAAAWTPTAWATDDGALMGFRHRDAPIEAVQFHPESVLTPTGPALLANFLLRVAAAAAPG